MFENLGGGEVLLIFLVILIFFGPKKIPELAGSLGKGLRKFRDAKDGFEDQIKTAMKEPMEALQVAKNNFDYHLNEAAKPLQETKAAFDQHVLETNQAIAPMAPTPAVATPAATTEEPTVTKEA
ncbi:MAG TPA: twin-arginine translocase TatA/TatE family subunit [Candidatus Kapabacteria bacterium]|nr:twin-arginine translocase TatA/TatE family subunit [Candidatus Kapabacteria bacterium]